MKAYFHSLIPEPVVGGSAASGFIMRMMAENKLKHKGDYKRPIDKFNYKKLASGPQGGEQGADSYGASPFIEKHFSKDKRLEGKPPKETPTQRVARHKALIKRLMDKAKEGLTLAEAEVKAEKIEHVGPSIEISEKAEEVKPKVKELSTKKEVKEPEKVTHFGDVVGPKPPKKKTKAEIKAEKHAEAVAEEKEHRKQNPELYGDKPSPELVAKRKAAKDAEKAAEKAKAREAKVKDKTPEQEYRADIEADEIWRDGLDADHIKEIEADFRSEYETATPAKKLELKSIYPWIGTLPRQKKHLAVLQEEYAKAKPSRKEKMRSLYPSDLYNLKGSGYYQCGC